MGILFLSSESIHSQKSDGLMLTRAKLSMMCGDVSLIFAHKRNVSYEDFISLSQDDEDFTKLCKKDVQNNGESLSTNDIDAMFKLDNEQLLIKTVFWYEKSLEHSPSNEEKENVLQVSI